MQFKTHERKFIYGGNRVWEFCLLNQMFNYLELRNKKCEKSRLKCLTLRNIFLRKDGKNLRHDSLDIIMMYIFHEFDGKKMKDDFDVTI
jgi:hypothetical protein